jgi:hypothetical protein
VLCPATVLVFACDFNTKNMKDGKETKKKKVQFFNQLAAPPRSAYGRRSFAVQ